MAKVTKVVDASPARVFAVLADGWTYSNWVVGTSHMRAVSSDWPAVGARVYHASGVWPAVTRDETVVEEVETDSRLVLTAKGGALGQARVVIELQPVSSGATTVTLTETPTAGPGKWIHNPINEAILARRNSETLARLAALAEARSTPVD